MTQNIDENNSINIVKTYDKEANPEILQITNNFIKHFFYDENGKVLNLNVVALNTITSIFKTLKEHQFSSKADPKQLSLFEAEHFTSIHNYSRVVLQNKHLSSNRDLTLIKETFTHLSDIKHYVEYTDTKGKKYSAQRRFIIDPVHSSGKTSFLISNFWIERILNLSGYFSVLSKTFEEIKDSRQIAFLFWIYTVKNDTGTEITYNNFCEKFNLNYKYQSEMIRSFLEPCKYKFKKSSIYSFDYTISKDKSKIRFFKYNSKEITETLLKKKIDKFEISRKVSYIKKRFNLSDVISKSLSDEFHRNFDLINDSYTILVKENRGSCNAKSMTNEEFVSNLNKIIKNRYSETHTSKIYPNNIPFIRLL